MISQAQAASNQAALEAANQNPIKCKLTGKKLIYKEDKQAWETGGDVEARFMKIRWGWMGKTYAPDEKNVIRELKGRVDGKLVFGGFIPEAGLKYHEQNMRRSGANIDSGVTVYEVKIEGGTDNVEDEAVPLEKMTVVQLIEIGVSKGLDKADLEKMKKSEIIELLK